MQESMISYSRYSFPLHRFSFMYQPTDSKKGAALSFHLTTREKKDIAAAVQDSTNERSVRVISEFGRYATAGKISSGH